MAAVAAPAGVDAQELRGRVVLQGWDEPSPAARVLLLDTLLLAVDSTQADESGRFTIRLPPSGAFAVQAVQGTAQSSIAGFFHAAVTTTDVVLELPSPLYALARACFENGVRQQVGTLVGVAFETASRLAVPGARVQVQWADSAGRTMVDEVTADEQGRYQICAVPAEAPLRLWVMGLGRASPPVEDVRVEGGSLHRVDLPIGDFRRAGIAYTSVTVLSSRRIGSIVEPAMLRGQILDANSGTPVRDVALSIEGAGAAVVTDSAGRFRFRNMPGGVHTLDIEQLGYGVQRTVVELAGGADTDVEVRLAAAPLELPGIAVDARRAMLMGIGPTSRSVVSGTRMEEFENRGAYLSDIVSGLPVRVTRRGPRVCFESRRGSGGCMAIFIDDVEVYDPGLYVDQIRAGELETVIYLSAIEAGFRFGLQAASTGALLIYTRGRGPFRDPRRERTR